MKQLRDTRDRYRVSYQVRVHTSEQTLFLISRTREGDALGRWHQIARESGWTLSFDEANQNEKNVRGFIISDEEEQLDITRSREPYGPYEEKEKNLRFYFTPNTNVLVFQFE